MAVIVVASIGCGDVGADQADAAAAVTGGRGGGAGTSAGGSGGSQAGRGGSAGSAGGSSDASGESRTDVQVDTSIDTSSDARLDVSIDVADARNDFRSDGAGGAGGGDAADTGAAGKGGAAGAGTAGAAGAAGASGAGGSAGGTMDAGDAGGAAGSDASVDTSDGAVDAGGPEAPTVLNEGGRDATTTTTEMILGAASADCLACAQNAGTLDPTCDLNQLACETFTDLAQRLNCLDTLACVLPPGSAVSCVNVSTVNLTPCYCGTVATADCLSGNADGGVYGACKGYIDVGFPGQSQSYIGTNISNINYSSGRAMKIAQCMGDIFNSSLDDRCGSCF